MSILIIKENGRIRILESDGEIPSGMAIRFSTEEKKYEMSALRSWSGLPEEARDDMRMQAQSGFHKDWMEAAEPANLVKQGGNSV